jgi:hypothetical protein
MDDMAGFARGVLASVSAVFPSDTVTGAAANMYPLSNPDNANVQIEELTWWRSNCCISLSLHEFIDRWIVIDSSRWQKDVAF